MCNCPCFVFQMFLSSILSVITIIGAVYCMLVSLQALSEGPLICSTQAKSTVSCEFSLKNLRWVTFCHIVSHSCSELSCTRLGFSLFWLLGQTLLGTWQHNTIGNVSQRSGGAATAQMICVWSHLNALVNLLQKLMVMCVCLLKVLGIYT